MAEITISDIIAEIEKASRGAEVRKPIIDALEYLNNNGGNAETLDHHPASYFAKAEDLAAKQDKVGFDTVPTKDSKKLVYSHNLWVILDSILKSLHTINGEKPEGNYDGPDSPGTPVDPDEDNHIF